MVFFPTRVLRRCPGRHRLFAMSLSARPELDDAPCLRCAIFLLPAVVSLALLGCGMAASPQPPSLQLPKPVTDLTAARAGNQVSLHWITPNQTTDKLKIHGAVKMRVCRQLEVKLCEPIATISSLAGKPGEYSDILSLPLTVGPLRAIHYQIAGLSPHGRVGGESNAAATLAGEAPPAITNLAVRTVEQGVVLHWQPVNSMATAIEIQRTLLTPPVESKVKTPSGLTSPSEPSVQKLRVAIIQKKSDPGRALDSSVIFGRKYQYVVIRAAELKVAKQTLCADSLPRAPVVIETRDILPPGVPTGLAAVPISAAMNGGQPEIDLSWSANTDPDLAQYLVFRRKVGNPTVSATTRMQQIAPANASAPIVAPAFRDMNVQPGRRYAYSIVAVDAAGNRSQPSPETIATVPGP